MTIGKFAAWIAALVFFFTYMGGFIYFILIYLLFKAVLDA